MTPALDPEDAACHLADAYDRGTECRVVACPTVHRHRDIHDWERERLIELATSLLAEAAR